MADNMFFSRDTKVYIAYLNASGAEVSSAVWEIPVLDGFSFSQATNTSEVTLNEMSAGSNVSRRGRKLFTDSYAPAEWSFSTYARPFATTGAGAGQADDTSGRQHCVEEPLWAMMATNATYTAPVDGASEAAWSAGITTDATDMDITFAGSNLTELAKANIYFAVGKTGESQIVYKLSDCCVNEAGIDFDIDGITTINWSGMGTMISEVSTHPAATRYEGTGVTATSNFIRNRLTELSAVSTLPANVTYGLTLTGGSITISNNMTFLTPETIGVINQPLGAVTGTRSVGGSFTCYMNNASNSSMDLFENIIEATGTVTNTFALGFKIGGAAGLPRLELNAGACHLEVPTHSIDDVISLEVNFHALGTDIDSTDELTVLYKGQ